jgi:TPR repeat protein
MRVLSLCISLVLCFAGNSALAQTASACEPAPESANDMSVAGDRIRQLIKEKRFAAVEDEFSDKVKRYGRGEYSDLHIYGMVYRATDNDVALEPLLSQWINEKPDAFAARLFRGAFHSSAGASKRGSETADKTSVEQFNAMEAEFKKAVTDLNVALELRPDSALPRAFLINVARSFSPDAVRSLMLEAEKADPANMSARYTSILALAPRWGGSMEDLDGIPARATGLTEAQRRFLRYQVEMSKGSHYDEMRKEKATALTHYQQAAQICTSSNALWKASSMAYTLEDWLAVRELMDRYLALRTGAALGWERRGWAEEKLGKMPDAISDYEKAAELGEAWSQNKLGYMLMTGQHMQRNLPRARQLLESAAAKGNTNARANLEWLSRQDPARQSVEK